jgi:PhnB protein
MPQNPPEGYPRLMPYLFYEDPAAAIDFLTSALGFTERYRMPGPDGDVAHAELEMDDALVMLGRPGPDYRNPKAIGAETSMLYIYVDDVDAHCAHARSAGAEITREPEDQFYGDRTYGVKDPEGHSWGFATRVRDVSQEELTQAMAGSSG